MVVAVLALPQAGKAADAAPSVSEPSFGNNGPSREGGGEGVIVPAIPGVPKIFLPDIGIAGDFAYERNTLNRSDPRYSASGQQPRIRDGQAVFFEPIDPYTNAQFTIDIPAGGAANIEEAWLYFNKLPGNAGLRVGRYLPVFGLLDLQNTFQLAMVNRPNSIGDYLSPDGLTGTGAALDFFIPNPWGLNLKANLNAMEGDLLGGSTQSLDLTYLATLDYSQDAFTSGSLQSGVSVAQGPSPVGGPETLVEPYMQVQYAPSQRRVWTWSAEGMFAERQGLGPNDSTRGFYTFLDYNFALRYHVGFLADVADQPVAPFGTQLSLAPNFTWFLSDNTRMRLQYTHVTPLGSLQTEEIVSMQVTFSLGNLKQLD